MFIYMKLNPGQYLFVGQEVYACKVLAIECCYTANPVSWSSGIHSVRGKLIMLTEIFSCGVEKPNSYSYFLVVMLTVHSHCL